MSMKNELPVISVMETAVPEHSENGGSPRTDFMPASSKADADLTGRRRLASNVLLSWLAQMVFIVAGFIMPRMIDQRLGQEMLGVWDFGWSVVAYFGLVSLGVIGSVNRYVALHRVKRDTAGLNESISSVFCLLTVMTAVVVILTFSAAYIVPNAMGMQLGEHRDEIFWVIIFLGLALAGQTLASAHAGVLTGCHQWKLHNALSAGGYALTVVAMIIALLLGSGIRGVALVYFCGDLLPTGIRAALAHRVCPELRIRWAFANWKTARSMLQFGGKSFVPSVAELLLNQTVNVLIVASMGPAALALYSRPRSLVLQVRTLVFKMAAVLMPSASSLHAVEGRARMADLLIKATRYSAYLTLPLTAAFVIMGGPILRIWMGLDYVNGPLTATLSLGYASFIIQSPAIAVLAGMNLHGRPGLANLLASILTAALVAVVIGPLQLGLVWVALAATFPLALVYSIYVPLYACSQLKIPLGHYTREVLLKPLATIIPYMGCLVAGRLLFPENALLALLTGGGIGSALLLWVYWKSVIPASLKNKLVGRLSKSKINYESSPAAQPPVGKT